MSIFAFRKWKSTENGRRVWDRVKLRLPMKIATPCARSRWRASLARCRRWWRPASTSSPPLEITAATSGNWVVEQSLMEVREKVHGGIPISQPLSENSAFPAMVGHMVKVGEETGELDKMLGKIADFYEDEVDTAIQALTSIIEPVMMICVGLVVGVIIISMYLPMFKMLSLVK